jgi:hypothetical protein
MTDNSAFAISNPDSCNDIIKVAAICYAASACFLSYFDIFRQVAHYFRERIGAILRREIALLGTEFSCFPPFMAIV